jgi:hypothetical protein
VLTSPHLPVKERLSAPLCPPSLAQHSRAISLETRRLLLGKVGVTRLYGGARLTCACSLKWFESGRAERSLSILRVARARRAWTRPSLRIHYRPKILGTTQHTMSITEFEQRCTVLRNDLKAWEKEFAAQHNGKKAGREDIKADAVICTHATRLVYIVC